jgi:5-methylcytosine-specific restriction protein B
MAFNQGTTYRDVWRGLEPKIGAANTFRMSEGVFWKANEFALEDDSTALVEVDELNRGPAVAALGEGVVALEADKRTAADGSFLDTTFTFPLRDDNGDPQAYGVSPHLYVLAAQNDADASIESIDLAWYRRFTPIKLMPDAAALIKLFDLTDLTADLPQGPDDAKAVYAAATRAWNSVNERIIVGRSADFQIGHGVFFRYNEQPPTTPKEALDYVRRGWSRIERHIDEVFYGEIEAMADALRVTATSKHPYKIERELFAEVERPVLVRGSIVADDDSFYELLKTIAEA